MKKYRIIKHTYNDVKFIPQEGKVIPITKTYYEAQKRFLGFLWWYNFNDIDGITIGMYSHLWEAEEVIESDIKRKHKKEIIKEYK